MKLSVGKRRVVIAGVALVVVLVGLAVGRSARDDQAGPLDDQARRACADFADGYPSARTTFARLTLSDRVARSVAGSGNDVIVDRVRAVGASANESDAAWKSAADALTRACRDADRS